MTLKKTSTNNSLTIRPPIVTVMGHVDHGKTSLLDAIRKTNVAGKEFGGITQHTAAYQITINDRKITFIDTPGHMAFSEMRSRGGKVADIVVLVVSAVDGVQPQTIEAIKHAKAAGVPIVVALNKIDLPEAHAGLEKIKQQLAEHEVLLESYGGDIVSVEVSAKTGLGLPQLLEVILLLADMAELKVNPALPFSGVVIESKMDSKKGPLASVIVREGSLVSGQKIYYGDKESKVRSLLDEGGQVVKIATAGDPVTILGLGAVPPVGAVLLSIPSLTSEEPKKQAQVTVNEGITRLKVVLKSDTRGTLEALLGAFCNLETEDKKLLVIASGVGDVSDSDVMLAATSESLILGFNVKIADSVSKKAIDSKVIVKIYPIIYEMLAEVEKILLEAKVPDLDLAKGRAEVVALFPLPSGDVIAGCRVTKGRLKVGEKVKLTRLEVPDVVYSGRIKNIKEGKQEVEIVTANKECGLLLRPLFPDLKKGDLLEIV